jgi:hypothetical protein
MNYKKFIFIFALMITLNTNVIAQKNKTQYIKLPDGAYYQVKEGESYEMALQSARETYPASFGLVKIPLEKLMDVDWFNQCRTKGVREARIEAAIGQIIQACNYQAIPKKCRAFQIKRDILGNESADERVKCVESCASENVYNKNFGECSKG